MFAAPEDWSWSRYLSHAFDEITPPWLDTDWMLTQFGTQKQSACQVFQQFVLQGIGLASPLTATRNQLFLGDDEFLAQHQAEEKLEQLRNVSNVDRRSLALSLIEYQEKYDRDVAMARAYRSGAYSMAQIAEHFGVNYMTVSRAVRKLEAS